jgi:hypothetical protein
MTAALFGLLVPTIIVYWALAPSGGLRRHGSTNLLYVGLAMGLAPGLTSCLWFGWLAAFGEPGAAYFAAESALLLVAAAVWRRRFETRPPPAPPSGTGAVPIRFVVPVLVLLGLGWVASFTANTLTNPHGSWDAISIWNLHARFLAAGGDRWIDLFRHSQCAWHGDYPLLVPASVARLSSTTGAALTTASALVSFWFSAATLLLCVAFVGCVRGANQALLVAVTLLGTSYFVQQSSAQYADVPLAWSMLAAVSALVLYDASGQSSAGWLVVAGAAAGLAAWTKNEGISFVVVIGVLHTTVSVRREGLRGAVRSTAPLAAGLLPVLLVVAYFKLALAPENDLVAGQGLHATLSRLLDASRYVQIAVALVAALFRMVKGLFFVLPAYFLLMGRTTTLRSRDGARFALATYGLMLISYCGVYVITPHELAWHLESSVRRLLLQLWPGALAIFFLMVAAPEERLAPHATPGTAGAAPQASAPARVPGALPSSAIRTP